MSKFKKVLFIILICLLVAFGLYVLIEFIINKDGTMYWINKVIEWVNQPLPIVGVSGVALFVFVWKVIKYIRDTKPSEELQAMRDEHNQYKKEKEEEIDFYKNENAKLKGYIIDICELSPNQKIKNYGKELLGHGKETIECETKAE